MAERKTLSVEAGGNTYELRVTMAGQLAIRKACGTPNALKGFGVALDGDPEAICEIFKAALTWAGNENSVKDGASFYDILVDAGYDEVSMDKLLLDIAATSGIMSAAQADVLKKRLDGLDDEVKSKNA